MRKRLLAALPAALVASALVAGPASADPQNRNSFGPIGVDCGDAGTFDVVTHGGGAFTAAQVLGSTQVLVPLAFANTSFSYTAPDGTVFPPQLDPPSVKGSGKQQGVWCHFSFDIDSGNGLENFSGEGDVYAKITPGP